MLPKSCCFLSYPTNLLSNVFRPFASKFFVFAISNLLYPFLQYLILQLPCIIFLSVHSSCSPSNHPLIFFWYFLSLDLTWPNHLAFCGYILWVIFDLPYAFIIWLFVPLLLSCIKSLLFFCCFMVRYRNIFVEDINNR